MRYTTPGLGAGRSTWSQRTEVTAWLRDLSSPVASPARSKRQSQAPSTALQVRLLSLGAPLSSVQALLLTHARPLPEVVTSKPVAAAPAADSTDASTAAPAVTPAAEPRLRPTVLLVGSGPNESAATDALLVVARELVRGKLRPLLTHMDVVIVPHVSQPFDAERDDHLLLDTAGAQVLAKLAQTHAATVVLTVNESPALIQIGTRVGLSLTDLTLERASTPNLPEFLTKAADQWFYQPMQDALQAQGLRTAAPVVAGIDDAAPLHMRHHTPDSSANAAGLKNQIGLQVTTLGSDLGHAHAQRRVHAQVMAISSVLTSTADRVTELSELKPYLDREVTAQACRQPMVIESEPKRVMQAISLIDLNTGLDSTLTLPVDSASEQKAVRSRVKPCGYWLAADAITAVERLRLHGAQVMRVTEPSSFLGDVYLVGDDARTRLDVRLMRGVIDAPIDSFYVPVDQPLGNLIAAALEPDTPTSFASHGLLDPADGLARIMSPPAVRLEQLP